MGVVEPALQAVAVLLPDAVHIDDAPHGAILKSHTVMLLSFRDP
jgi:hypothetical protein